MPPAATAPPRAAALPPPPPLLLLPRTLLPHWTHTAACPRSDLPPPPPIPHPYSRLHSSNTPSQSIKNGKYLAIKCMKNHFDSIEQVNNLREIQALRRLSPHPNIIKLYEVL